jgi:hypothetical protein
MKTMLYVPLGWRTQFLSTGLVGLLLFGSGFWMKTQIEELNSISDQITQILAFPAHSRSWDQHQILDPMQQGAPAVDPAIKLLPGAKLPVGT